MSRTSLVTKIYWTVAFLAIFVLVFLVSVQFLNPSSVGNPDFVGNTYLWAVVWALNFLLLLVLSFILARDLVKLFFEYQGRRPGSRIKAKLITTFILFSLFPALIMSFLAFGLINRNLRLWFTSPSEQILESSELIVAEFYAQNREHLGKAAGWLIEQTWDPSRGWSSGALQSYLDDSGFEAVSAYDVTGSQQALAGRWLGSEEVGGIIGQVLRGQPYYSHRRLLEIGQADSDLVTIGVPVLDRAGEVAGVLVGQSVIPRSVEFHGIQAAEARLKYDALKTSVSQLEYNYYAILLLTTMAVIFAFVWLGAYIARRITVPLEALAQGAGELAAGNLDHRVDVMAVDELGILVDSFNRMAGEIRQSRLQLEKANAELRSTNLELDERRRYTETILQNIATGVLSLDQDNRIRTANQAALSMLQTTASEVEGHKLGEVAGSQMEEAFENMKEPASLYGSCRLDITFSRDDQQRFIAATVTSSRPQTGEGTEYLLVLDDLTELIRAEKFAAWQEVARRLAHEIKNPLTPIQLSVERIRKRFDKIADRGRPEMASFQDVLDQSVRVISAEAEILKTLVNEFSRFARLPVSRPQSVDLNELIGETLARYDGSLGSVQVTADLDPQLGKLKIDPEQMRRVFSNLIDNALHALAESNGDRRLSVRTRLNRSQGSVTVEIADSGVGIAPEDYENLFLPYFSTKKRGTGLGLAIVRQIVSEHQGRIWAEPNRPRGMKFTISLPI